VEALAESFLVFGRASLGAAIGLAIGWLTQRERHVRYVLALLLLGYAAGTALMWPHWPAIMASVVLLVPCTLGAFFGLAFGAATMGTREDWWIRSWGFAGFLVTFHVLALFSAAMITMSED
jgi:hypothetical protein